MVTILALLTSCFYSTLDAAVVWVALRMTKACPLHLSIDCEGMGQKAKLSLENSGRIDTKMRVQYYSPAAVLLRECFLIFDNSSAIFIRKT
jgi:hypothetical protein